MKKLSSSNYQINTNYKMDDEVYLTTNRLLHGIEMNIE